MTKTVSWAGALGHASSDKRIEILRLIGQGGSISQAAREAGVSYKAAWQAIDTLTNLAGVALVERVVGGAGGGGARITPAGLRLLEAADKVEGARRQVLANLQPGGGAGTGQLSGIAQLSVRTSMRNQLPCTVKMLEGSGRIVRVHLLLADGGVLVSRITRESAELLALHQGQPVLALCKATAVSVEPEADARAPGKSRSVNLLPGRATRVSRSASEDEVSLALGSGLQFVGFAPAQSGIRVRSRVVARVEESAVVVALAG